MSLSIKKLLQSSAIATVLATTLFLQSCGTGSSRDALTGETSGDPVGDIISAVADTLIGPPYDKFANDVETVQEAQRRTQLAEEKQRQNVRNPFEVAPHIIKPENISLLDKKTAQGVKEAGLDSSMAMCAHYAIDSTGLAYPNQFMNKDSEVVKYDFNENIESTNRIIGNKIQFSKEQSLKHESTEGTSMFIALSKDSVMFRSKNDGIPTKNDGVSSVTSLNSDEIITTYMEQNPELRSANTWDLTVSTGRSVAKLKEALTACLDHIKSGTVKLAESLKTPTQPEAKQETSNIIPTAKEEGDATTLAELSARYQKAATVEPQLPAGTTSDEEVRIKGGQELIDAFEIEHNKKAECGKQAASILTDIELGNDLSYRDLTSSPNNKGGVSYTLIAKDDADNDAIKLTSIFDKSGNVAFQTRTLVDLKITRNNGAELVSESAFQRIIGKVARDSYSNCLN